VVVRIRGRPTDPLPVSAVMPHHSMWPYWVIIPAWAFTMAFCGYAVVMPPAEAASTQALEEVLPDPPGGLYGLQPERTDISAQEFKHDSLYILGKAFVKLGEQGVKFNPEDRDFRQWVEERLYRYYRSIGVTPHAY